MDKQSILQIPNALFASFSQDQKKAFLQWKNGTVYGESVANDDIGNILKKESSKNSGLRKRRESRAMKIQCT
eukprot:10902585-Ditylum_brightwellii.AAC.1